MCRIFAIRDETTFNIAEMLEKFAHISENSKEYQGHGWGCAYLDENNEWQYYKNIKPIWEDDLDQFKETETTCLIAHARSAFQDKGIVIENNMPFYDDEFIYIFNGELRGVRIKEEGRIGAEKIFNFIKRWKEEGSTQAMMEKGARLIEKRSKYVRALNIIIGEKETNKLYVTNIFNEDPDYFQMWYKIIGHRVMVCSDPFEKENDWEKLETNKVVVL